MKRGTPRIMALLYEVISWYAVIFWTKGKTARTGTPFQNALFS
jgi:hypothetical protein